MSTPASAGAGLDGWLRRYATQATAALSLVVGVTGVMMFFHLFKGEVEGMHEWLGMAFVVAVAAHVLRHRHGFVAMLGQPRMRALALGAVAVAAAFLMMPKEEGGNPFRKTTDLVMRAPLADVAPLVGVPAAELAARLGTDDTSQSILSLAKARGAEPPELLGKALGR